MKSYQLHDCSENSDTSYENYALHCNETVLISVTVVTLATIVTSVTVMTVVTVAPNQMLQKEEKIYFFLLLLGIFKHGIIKIILIIIEDKCI